MSFIISRNSFPFIASWGNELVVPTLLFIMRFVSSYKRLLLLGKLWLGGTQRNFLRHPLSLKVVCQRMPKMQLDSFASVCSKFAMCLAGEYIQLDENEDNFDSIENTYDVVSCLKDVKR